MLLADRQPLMHRERNLYSIVESAKANAVEQHAYLSLLFAMLPWNVKDELAAMALRWTS